ncbi:hypothetical protein [Deinococcus saxicola]|uniref:hypothetical protein n=1 Tax=Deinococcus saxicola TaxID=249406 RepID=UPI0039EFEBD3
MSEVPPPPVQHLPLLKEWQQLNSGEFGLSDLLAAEGNLDIITACAQLFWPKFIEIDGCVLREDVYSPENFQNWMTSTNGNRISVESVMNHIHIYDILPNPGGQEYRGPEYALEVFEYIAEILQRTWKAALAEKFPSKTFIFKYVTEPDDYGPTIYF